MDVFVEQMIKRKKSGADYGIIAGTVVLGFLIVAAAIILPFLARFLLILIAGVCFGVYYVASSRNLEFEYSATNGDFTVDKIVNRRSRKRVCQFDLKSVEAMGKYDAAAFQNKTFDRQLKVGVDDAGTDAWYLIVRLKDSGNTFLLFSPNEKMLAAMKPFLPRQVSVNAFRRH